tara:strand:+ start:1414 stop:2091 length:678 start_codon:yes stop_codon:yes gene_type:complete
MATNLQNFDYDKTKLEHVIYDDCKDNKLFINIQELEYYKSLVYPIKVNYIYNPKRHLTIGEKRNLLVKNAKYKILINMDDDDIYFPTYLKYSVDLLIKNNVGIVGSPEMMFLFPNDDYKMTAIQCEGKHQAHEATFCFTKKHFNSMGGFGKNSKGEGTKMITFNENRAMMSEIKFCMCCIGHSNNTVDKKQFMDTQELELSEYIIKVYVPILEHIFENNYYEIIE